MFYGNKLIIQYNKVICERNVCVSPQSVAFRLFGKQKNIIT